MGEFGGVGSVLVPHDGVALLFYTINLHLLFSTHYLPCPGLSQPIPPPVRGPQPLPTKGTEQVSLTLPTPAEGQLSPLSLHRRDPDQSENECAWPLLNKQLLLCSPQASGKAQHPSAAPRVAQNSLQSGPRGPCGAQAKARGHSTEQFTKTHRQEGGRSCSCGGVEKIGRGGRQVNRLGLLGRHGGR